MKRIVGRESERRLILTNGVFGAFLYDNLTRFSVRSQNVRRDNTDDETHRLPFLDLPLSSLW